MSWRRCCGLTSGRSPQALYRCLTSSRAQARRPLRAADAGAFFASFPKAGE